MDGYPARKSATDFRLLLNAGSDVHGPREVAFSPYPFDVHPLQVEISYKRLPAAPFDDLESFRRAYWQAENCLLTYTLC